MTFGGQIFTECPESLITTESRWLLELYSLADSFHTPPFPGTVSEWPAFFVHAVSIIQEELARMYQSDKPKQSGDTIPMTEFFK